MKIATLLCMLVLAVSASMGQDNAQMTIPKLKEVPVTHTELTCDKGYELWNLTKNAQVITDSGSLTINGFYMSPETHTICVSTDLISKLRFVDKTKN